MSDVDSLDDGQLYDFADDTAFPASGELQLVNYSDVSTLVMPELRAHLRARGKTPAGGRASLVDRLQKCLIETGESYPPNAEMPDPPAPEEPNHSKDMHVNYIFGAAYRDGPEGPAPAGTPRVRKSITKLRPDGLHLPYGSEADQPSPHAAAASPGRSPRVSLSAPFKTDESVQFPQRSEQLPSAPPASPSSATAAALAVVAKMSVAELRETLRGRGLSPAGGLAALQERLTDALKGLPLDTPAFEQKDSGIAWPDRTEVDPGSKPTHRHSSVRISASSGSGGGNSSLAYTLGAGGLV